MNKRAVVLFNLGGPSSEEDIFPFLSRFFYDPAILPFSKPIRYILANLIAWGRLRKAKDIYAYLGGKSPLLVHTEDQAKALQERCGKRYEIFVCMRHAAPFIEEVVETIKRGRYEEIILLPLFPQYSTTTTGSFFEEWRRKAKDLQIPTRFISSYPTNEEFIEALKEISMPYYRKAEKYGEPAVLLTAHGLPEKTIKRGDPYQRQVLETANKIKEKAGFKKAIVCYQSRVGWLPWIKPFLEDTIVQKAREKRPLVVIPLSFVSEHSETLVELDIQMRELALSQGCPYYGRVPTVQTHPRFIAGLASLLGE